MFLTINNKEIEAKELGGYYLEIDDLETKQYLIDLLDLNKSASEYKISIPYRTNNNSSGFYGGCFYINNTIHYDYKKILNKGNPKINRKVYEIVLGKMGNFSKLEEITKPITTKTLCIGSNEHNNGGYIITLYYIQENEYSCRMLYRDQLLFSDTLEN